MSTTYTTNYHLGKQEDTSDNFNMSVITDNMDTIDSALGNKSDKSSTYTKTEVDAALGSKQNTISDLATIRSGAALGATAVQPETGKGLSTNDYTTTEKTKLAGIAEGAEVNEIEGIKVNNTTINPDANKVVKITIPTTAADVSALPDTTKYAVALSLTINSSTFVMTGQLKDQNGDNLGTAQTIDLPLESVVVGGSYNSQTKKVVLTLQNGNTIEFSVADLVSGLQTELSASNKLNPAYINYDSTHRAVSDTEKSTWNGKQNALTTSQLAAANSGIDSTKVEQIETNKNNILFNTNQGVKNLFNLTKVSGTYSTVVFTVNSDKTVTVNGTASPANSVFNLGNWTCTKAGKYVISGAPSGGSWAPSLNTYRIRVAVNEVWKGDDVGNGYALTLAVGDVVNLQINTSTSYTANNLVFKPMITLKSLYDADPTYQPYAPTNRELYETKADTSELYAFLPNITSSTTIRDYVDSLSKGVYKAFIANASNPSDSPINANCFVNIYVYSTTTAAVELIPISTAETSRTYTMRKIVGTWGSWYKFEGTAVT